MHALLSPLLTHGGALALGLLIAATVQSWRYEARISDAEAAADKARATAAQWVIDEQARSAAVVAAADEQATGVVSNARKETEQLRDCIERGSGCGLRVKVVRTPANCVPEAGSPSGVGDGSSETAELDASSRRAYYTLRDRLPVLEQALKVCVSATQQP